MASYGRGELDGGYSSYQSGGFSGQSRENEFSRLSQTVSQTIQKITQNVSQLQRMVGQIGTTADSDQFRERMHQTTHYTNQLAKDANRDLKELMHLPNPPNSSEQRQRKMLKERLTDEFSNALKNFQTVQRTAAEKEKASISRARANSGLNKSPFGFDDDERKSDDQLVGYSQTKQVLQMEEDVDLELIREREDAIKKLESDIMDVNTIFKDLGMLVHEQGEVIDSIEANVESAHLSVQEGTQQLSSARQYQSKARRKKCCILIIVVVVLIVIGIIIAIAVPKS
ncbi:syntaxin-7-like isoform X2 [Liolophura sinensis]|uniref:syntaxin-7-like isoform X2 n=1 Tax=Liolophura sinensis TaxID=3198878 RepID=UPI003158E7EB